MPRVGREEGEAYVECLEVPEGQRDWRWEGERESKRRIMEVRLEGWVEEIMEGLVDHDDHYGGRVENRGGNGECTGTHWRMLMLSRQRWPGLERGRQILDLFQRSYGLDLSVD